MGLANIYSEFLLTRKKKRIFLLLQTIAFVQNNNLCTSINKKRKHSSFIKNSKLMQLFLHSPSLSLSLLELPSNDNSLRLTKNRNNNYNNDKWRKKVIIIVMITIVIPLHVFHWYECKRKFNSCTFFFLSLFLFTIEIKWYISCIIFSLATILLHE